MQKTSAGMLHLGTISEAAFQTGEDLWPRPKMTTKFTCHAHFNTLLEAFTPTPIFSHRILAN